MEILERVCRGERLDTYETERVRADGGRVAVSLTVSPIVSPAQGLVGASVIARDITAEWRRRAAQDFLVAASRGLDASLDFQETARTIVETAIPEMAEICVLDFVLDGHRTGDSIVAGVDPEAARRLEQIRRESPLDLDGDHPVAQVLRAGEPMVWRSLTDPGVVEKVAQSEAHRQLMRDAGYNSAAVVGLVARGRTLGALSFLHAHEDLRYDPDELSFLGELGDRAAMALDNARLFEERDQIADDMQRGLRPPEPPAVPGLELSVVFEPVGKGIEVGGDFYDVIPTDDGCWLLIGDVAGKGSAAAAVSVAVRHAVRALSREIDDPHEILAHVNAQLREGASLNDFATTELIRLRRGDDGWTLDLAAAGHPPAIHLDGRGTRQLGGGSILGAWEEPAIERHRTALASGETLVLSTDGWFEVGPVAGHRYPECLGSEVEARAGLGLAELTEQLRADALERADGELKDDMVLLAVRPN
jgi:serine phosphatase RsbU (regulator of sigma subunit)